MELRIKRRLTQTAVEHVRLRRNVEMDRAAALNWIARVDTAMIIFVKVGITILFHRL